ncbi:rhamnulokinase [Salinactinospora qingdaonensis]|uniref:Rhamnulokinase family protein n=1 Tax=Salinactinospora qingdaonensis TaxID=702744 RepID=A0ABP7FLH4_9ACTN
MPQTLTAVDLGASSGRVLVGRVGRDELRLTEVHRFANDPVRLPSGLHWNIAAIYQEILRGLAMAASHGPTSVGIDAWAVDYGLLDAGGALLGLPHHYRDDRTETVAATVVAEYGAAELYRANGLQFQPFNTMFQVAAARGSVALEGAATLLLIPDLLGYWLTGNVGAEVTNASTTGLLDVTTRQWSPQVAAAVGLNPDLLPALRRPGAVIGRPRPEVARATGLEHTSVTAVASHDTASAVAGVPAVDGEFGYVSCGTWSLAGLELPQPVTSEDARAANFTNELGVDGTTRFLRNIMGLWLLQESMRTWGLGSAELPGLLEEAAKAPPFVSLVDPSDPRFLPPGDMPDRIAAYCRETDQPVPADRAALVRCVLESLALGHRDALRRAAAIADRSVRTVHLVGGGARNALLCQWTADALGLPVVAGPVEATAVGNMLVQAQAHGVADDLAPLRRLVHETHNLCRYEPHGDRGAWDSAARRIGLE